jgi:rubredoxin
MKAVTVLTGDNIINYTAWTGYATLVINKLEYITGELGALRVYSTEMTYDGRVHYMNATESGSYLDDRTIFDGFDVVLAGGTLHVTVKYAYNTDNGGIYSAEFTGKTDAGAYYVKASIDADTNYNAWSGEAVLVIERLKWDEEGGLGERYLIGGGTVNFDAANHYLSVSASSAGTPLSQVTAFDVTLNGGTDYETTIEFTVVYTYYLGAAGTGEYGDAGNFAYAYGAGIYNVKAEIAGGEGYNWDGWSDTAVLTVNKLHWTNDGGELGARYLVGGGTFTYNGTERCVSISTDSGETPSSQITSFVITVNGTPFTFEVSYTYYEGAAGTGDYGDDGAFVTAGDAGIYNIRAEIADGGNFDGWTATTVLTINKISWGGTVGAISLVGGKTITFDGATHYVAVGFDGVTDVSPVTELSVTVDDNTVVIPVSYTYYTGVTGTGDYTAEFTGAYNSAIYNIKAAVAETNDWDGFTATTVLTINKIKWNNDEGNFDTLYLDGNTLTYDTATHFAGVSKENAWFDGAADSLSYTVGAASFTVPIIYTYYKGASGAYSTAFAGASDAGIYNIKAVIEESVNYEGWTSTAVLTINKIAWNGTAHNFRLVSSEDISVTYDMITRYASFSYCDAGDTAADGNTDSRTSELYFNITTEGTESFLSSTDTHNATLSVTWMYNTDSGSVYNKVFASATDAGTYYIKISVAGGENIESFALYQTISVQKLSWTNTEGHLGALYIEGNTLVYDTLTHYAGVSRTDGVWVDDAVNTVSVVLAGGTLNLTVSYMYNTDGSEIYGLVFDGASNRGIYNIKAAVEGTVNYDAWTGTAVLTVTRLTFDEGEIADGHLGALYFDAPADTDSPADGYGDTVYDSLVHYIGVSKTSGYSDNYITSLGYVLANGVTLAVPVSYSFTYEGETGSDYSAGLKNAGRYVVTATVSEPNGNYEEKIMTACLEIKKFSTSIVWNGETDRTYNGYDQSSSVSATMALTAAEGTFGAEIVFYRKSDLSDYSGYTPANVFLTDASGIKVDGTQTDDLTEKTAYPFFHAGDYYAVAMFDDTNYDVGNSCEFVKEFSMEKAVINRYLVSNSIVYDACTHYIAVSETDVTLDAEPSDTIELLGGNTASVTYLYNTDNGGVYGETFDGARHAGTYYLSVTIAATDDYCAWNRTATLYIAKRGLTVASSPVNGTDWAKVYDRTADYVTYTVSGWQNGDEAKTVFFGAYADYHAGTGKTITFTITDAEGISAADSVSGDYVWDNVTAGVIFAKELKLVENIDWTKEYDGTNVAKATLDGVVITDYVANLAEGYRTVDGDDITITAGYDSKDVGGVTEVEFGIVGDNSSDYFMNNIVETGLITVRVTAVSWMNTELVYNGCERYGADGTGTYTYAYMELVGDDVTDTGLSTNGVLSCVLTYSGVYRNAGAYALTVNDPRFVSGTGENADYSFVGGNYRVANSDLSKNCVIAKLEVNVEWVTVGTVGQRTDGELVYIGEAFTLTVRVQLVGTDIDSYATDNPYIYFAVAASDADMTDADGITVVKDGTRLGEFKNAGIYTLTVVMNAGDLEQNYELRNFTLSGDDATIEKADISDYFTFGNAYDEVGAEETFDSTEIYFIKDGSGNYEQASVTEFASGVTYYRLDGVQNYTYYDGVRRYFYAVGGAESENYHYTDNSAWASELTKNYEYDDIPVTVIYSGGSETLHSVGSAYAYDANGVRNAGIYTITATVIETDNYFGWNGGITVIIRKGAIDNIGISDRLTDGSGAPLVYNGQDYGIYAAQKEVGGADSFNVSDTAVYYPDGVSADIVYTVVRLAATGDLTYANALAGTVTYAVDGNGNYVFASGADAFAADAAGNDEVGYYLVTASVTGENNYNDWIRTAILRIVKYDTTIIWKADESGVKIEFGAKTFTYSGLDQLGSVYAYIGLLGADGVGGENSVRLVILTGPSSDYAAAYYSQNGVDGEFRLAGTYDFSASVEDTDLFGETQKARITRNYNVANADISATMAKFTVNIVWYLDGYENAYDAANPPLYDSIEHNIYAVGNGVAYASSYTSGSGVSYSSSTVPLSQDSGDWAVTNAGTGYTCEITGIGTSIKEQIKNYNSDGTYTLYGYTDYAYNYALSEFNRSLEWAISKRILSVTISEDANELRKYYDGESAFTFSTDSGTGRVLTYEYVDTGEVINRNGQVVKIYNQKGTAYIDGIDGYDYISYTIEGILEADTYQVHVCPKCGYTYYESNTNSYTYDTADGYGTVTYEAGTSWNDVSDDYECPHCKQIAAAAADALITNLDEMEFYADLLKSKYGFVRISEIIDELYSLYQGNGMADLDYCEIVLKAALNVYEMLDTTVSDIPDTTLEEIIAARVNVLNGMASALPSTITFKQYAAILNMRKLYEELNTYVSQNGFTSLASEISSVGDKITAAENALSSAVAAVTTQDLFNGLLSSVTLADIDAALSEYIIFNNLTAAQQSAVGNNYLVSNAVENIGILINDIIDAITVAESKTSYDVIVNAIALSEADYYYNKVLYSMDELARLLDDGSAGAGKANSFVTSYSKCSSLDYTYKTMLTSGDEMSISENTVVAARLTYEDLPEDIKYIVSSTSYIAKSEAKILSGLASSLVTAYSSVIDSLSSQSYATVFDALADVNYAYNKYTEYVGYTGGSSSTEWYLGSEDEDTIVSYHTKAVALSSSVTVSKVLDALQTVAYKTSVEDSKKIFVGARLYYEMLSESDRSQVGNYSSFVEKETAFAANITTDIINAIGSVTRQSSVAVAYAKRIYDYLADAQRAYIQDSYDGKMTAYKNLFSLDLSSVVLSDEEILGEAKTTYDSLSNSTKAYVSYASVLKQAEAALIMLRIQLILSDGVDAGDGSAYEYANALYTAASSDVRAMVKNASGLADIASALASASTSQTEVEALIAAIDNGGAFTVGEIESAAAARSAYDALVNAGGGVSAESLSALQAEETRIYDYISSTYAELLTGGELVMAFSYRAGIVALKLLYSVSSSEVKALFTSEEQSKISGLYTDLCEFIRADAICKKASFTAQGDFITLSPETIVTKDANGEIVSNVTATNADISWSNFDSTNYTLETDSSGVTGKTNIAAEIIALPVAVTVGSATDNKIYDGQTLEHIMNADNKVTKAVTETVEGVTHAGWNDVILKFARTVTVTGAAADIALNSLIAGNYIVGTITIAGYDYAGVYTVGLTDASVNASQLYHNFVVLRQGTEGAYFYIKILDADGNENYSVTVYLDTDNPIESGSDTYAKAVTAPFVSGSGTTEYSQYTIEPRNLTITYNYLLQSWQETAKDITANSIVDPLAGTENRDLTDEKFDALLLSDGLKSGGAVVPSSVTVVNNWASSLTVRDTYYKITGTANEEGLLYVHLTSDRNNVNYIINMPVLQIVYLHVVSSDGYKLSVSTAEDLVRMGADMEGLRSARINDGIGALPSLYQLNDISGITAVGFAIISNAGVFDGIYYGQNHTVSDLMIAGTTGEAGLFTTLYGTADGTTGETVGGIIKNLTLKNIVFVSRNAASAGIVAGGAEGGLIENVSVTGSVAVDRNSASDVTVGGIVGEASDLQLKNTAFVGRITVCGESGITAGGVAGSYSTASAFDTKPVSGAYFFGTVLAKNVSTSNNVGGVFGTVSLYGGAALADATENLGYLKACATIILLNGEEPSYSFIDRAVGGDASTVGGDDGKTYSALAADTGSAYYAAVYNLVTDYLMRDDMLSVGMFSLNGVTDKTSVGTAENPIYVGNFRRLALMEYMPWLCYAVGSCLYVPRSFCVDVPFAVYSVAASSSETGTYGDVAWKKVTFETDLYSSDSENNNIYTYYVNIYARN